MEGCNLSQEELAAFVAATRACVWAAPEGPGARMPGDLRAHIPGGDTTVGFLVEAEILRRQIGRRHGATVLRDHQPVSWC